MAYYVIDQTTNELIFVSDSPNHFVTNGHHVHNSPISASELNTRYEWDRDQSTFILRPTRLSKREFIRKFTVQEFVTNIKNMLTLAEDTGIKITDSKLKHIVKFL